MAKKVKRKKAFKKPVKKVASVSRAKRLVSVARQQTPQKTRRWMILKDLILFAVLALISYMLYSITGEAKQIYKNTFLLLAIILGAIALAFLIVFLVIIFSQGKMKNK